MASRTDSKPVRSRLPLECAFFAMLLAAWMTPSFASQTGALDARFQSGGTPGVLEIGDASTHDEVLGIASDRQNRIYVARITTPTAGGSSAVVVQRYSSEGVLDAGFGSAGVYTASAPPNTFLSLPTLRRGGLDLFDDGIDEFLAVTYGNGDDIYVELLTFDGTLIAETSADWDLMPDGADVPLAVEICSPNQIVVVGGAEKVGAVSDAGVAVFEYDTGSRGVFGLKTTFNGTGLRTIDVNTGSSTDFFEEVACDGDKVVAVGRSEAGFTDVVAVVARMTAAGALDSTFDTDGVATYLRADCNPPIRGVLIAPSIFRDVWIDGAGSLYAAGVELTLSSGFVMKIQPNGATDTTFGSGGCAYVPNIPLTGSPGALDDQFPVAIAEVAGEVVLTGEVSWSDEGTFVTGAFYAAFDAASGAGSTRWQGGSVGGFPSAEAEFYTIAGTTDVDGSLLLLSSFGDTMVEDRQLQLTKIFGGIFTDGFESGTLTAW